VWCRRVIVDRPRSIGTWRSHDRVPDAAGARLREHPVPEDHLDDLLPAARAILGERPSRAAVYDLEQAVQENVTKDVLSGAIEGRLVLDDLLSDHFLRDLHARLYEKVWIWAGVLRRRELNIGVAPERIAVELRTSLDDIRHRWESARDWTARELGIAAHAETVRIHPFTDGNGRTTRLLADAVFLAAQEGEALEQYDWDLDKRRYIDLLRSYDRHRDPRELAAFVQVHPFGE
jgi:fido (protein-threonine AMPylation protein)